jgi:cytochrome oxidase Cu insertion factor (SCO1/SenC/PrrC family)
MNPWLKWGLVVLAGMIVVVASLLVGGVWLVTSWAAPDVDPGEAMPSIDLTDLDGLPVSLESYRGRVVVLDFWSSW